MSKEIDTSRKDDIICPHCGHTYTESWEVADYNNEGEQDCAECGKKFYWVEHRVVTYTTEKLE